MRGLLLSNPLYVVGAVLVLLLATVIAFKLVKGVVKVVVILVLIALIAVAVVWLKGMGPIAG